MQTEVLIITEPRPYADGGCSGCVVTVLTPFFILSFKYKTLFLGIICGGAIAWALIILIPHLFRHFKEVNAWRKRMKGNQARIELSDTHVSSYSREGVLIGHYPLNEIVDLAMFQGYDDKHNRFEERVIRFTDGPEISFFLPWTDRLNRKRFVRFLQRRTGKTFQYRSNKTRHPANSAS